MDDLLPFLEGVLLHVYVGSFGFHILLDLFQLDEFALGQATRSEGSFSKTVLGVKIFGGEGRGSECRPQILLIELPTHVLDGFLVWGLHHSRVLLTISGRGYIFYVDLQGGLFGDG